MAPVYLEFLKNKHYFETKVCVTGQHRQMLDQVLNIFEIVPDFDLNVMKPNQTLAEITSNIILGMDKIFNEFKADYVLVHGDTTTTLAVSLSAFYKKIKICHVEAGLRTYNFDSPWPEEMNRQITDKLTNIYFAPTLTSKENLLKELVASEKIYITGNTVIDALLIAQSKIELNLDLNIEIKNQLKLVGFNSENCKFILVTGHRRENFGEGFINICRAIKRIALDYPDIDIVYPVHLNENVQKPVFGLLSNLKNVYLIQPLEYLQFIYLLSRAYLVLTDSGGIQEEAPALGKPVLVMREDTERPEAIEAGTAKLVGTSTEQIYKNVKLLLEDKKIYLAMSKAHNPYGDGKSSSQIVKAMMNNLN